MFLKKKYWVGTKVRSVFLALKFLYFKNSYILQN